MVFNVNDDLADDISKDQYTKFSCSLFQQNTCRCMLIILLTGQLDIEHFLVEATASA